MSPLVFVKTFGCQSNKSDSERILGDYHARGFKETPSWKKATEIVINSCSVRKSAEDRVYGLLYNINTYFAENPRPDLPSGKPKVIVTGCMTHFGVKKLLELLPGVDEVLPIGEVGFNSPSIRRDKRHAWVPISSGCNSFCTFCIVPFSRGREISRPQADILAEVSSLARQDYTEITLLGQNVNSYGLEKAGIGFRKLLLSRPSFDLADIPTNQSQYLDPKNTSPFVLLIREISQIPGIAKISFMTSNPWDFRADLITEIASNPKIDRFLHLPIQSGSDRILKLMNRGYTAADYLNLVDTIRQQITDVVLGTDIIVGFPGETDEDFAATVDLAKKVNWHIAFVAQYSPRPGTASARLYPDDVPQKIKKHRWEVLDELINKRQLNIRPHIN